MPNGGVHPVDPEKVFIHVVGLCLCGLKAINVKYSVVNCNVHWHFSLGDEEWGLWPKQSISE